VLPLISYDKTAAVFEIPTKLRTYVFTDGVCQQLNWEALEMWKALWQSVSPAPLL